MAETYDFTSPLVNFSCLVVGVNGKKQMKVLKSAEVSEEIERKNVVDTNANIPIGDLPPIWKSGSLTLEYANVKYSQELIESLGNGYMSPVFPITFVIASKGQKQITVSCGKCSIKKAGFSASGTDSIAEKIEFILHEPVKRNGLSAVDFS